MSFGAGRGGSDGCCDPVGVLNSAVDGLLDQGPGGLTDEELRTDLLRLRREIDRLEAVFAMRVQAANRRAVGRCRAVARDRPGMGGRDDHVDRGRDDRERTRRELR
jgi:hypothetical protein